MYDVADVRMLPRVTASSLFSRVIYCEGPLWEWTTRCDDGKDTYEESPVSAFDQPPFPPKPRWTADKPTPLDLAPEYHHPTQGVCLNISGVSSGEGNPLLATRCWMYGIVLVHSATLFYITIR